MYTRITKAGGRQYLQLVSARTGSCRAPEVRQFAGGFWLLV